MDFVRPSTSCRVLVLVACLGVFTEELRAADGDGQIDDAARFFSAEAVSEANDIIHAIESLYERDVRVETYQEVPESLKDDLARDGREKFYDDWLNRRAKELGVRGVFVLITRTPGRVQVGVDRATRRRAFTADDADALRQALVTAFRAGRHDRGLVDGLRFVRRRLDENTARDRNAIVPVARGRGRDHARG